jgi:site-specific DNA-cytosine methylase
LEKGEFAKRIFKKLVKTPQAEIRGYGHGKEEREEIKKQYLELLEIMNRGETVPTPTQTDYKGRPKDEKYLKKKSRVHYVFTQVITPELCSLIMGFPSFYEFLGSKTQQYRQIGNAVCPPIARAIYKAILKQPTLKTFVKVN